MFLANFTLLCQGQEVEPTNTIEELPLVATFTSIALCYDDCSEALRAVLEARLNSMPCNRDSLFLRTIDACENCVKRSSDRIDDIFDNDVEEYIRGCIGMFSDIVR